MSEKTVAVPESVDLRMVSIDSVQPNGWNPNEMDAATFTDLVNDIKAQGNDQPTIVREVELPDGTKVFEVVDGEHRLRASKEAGLKEILVSVKHDWNEEEAKLQTLRRNALRGHNNPYKFTQLVSALNKKGLDFENIRARASLPAKDFKKIYKGMTEDTFASAKKAADAVEDQSAKTFAVAGLSQMVRELVEKHGDTLPYGYVGFMFRGQTNLMVAMDKAMLASVAQLKSLVKADNLPDTVFTAAITKALALVVSELESTGAVAELQDL